MPTFQTSNHVAVNIKREVTFATAPGATGALTLRKTDSPGLTLERAIIQSQEKRADGVTPMGRLGYKTVTGGYNSEATIGGAVDSLLEAIMRSTWVAAVAITEATAGLTSITTTTSTIVAAAGSWITAGVRVGDLVRLTGHATSANNNLTLRVVSVSALTLTVAGTPLTADAVADTAFTLTILKKLKTATTPTRYSYAIDQYDQDIDLSELFLGCRCIEMNLSFRPGQPAQLRWAFLGVDRTPLATGTSPYYTSATETTGLGLIVEDSYIRYNGSDVATFTGMDLTFRISAEGIGVMGSFVTPDVFDNDLTVGGTITALRSDFAALTLYDAETEFELFLLLKEPESEPADSLSFFFPRVKIAALSAPVGGGDGPKVETRGLMIGPKAAATGYDATVCTICSSAA